ncbi:MAG: MarR family transcriptional regulator [Spirochaetales bacterium]|nr:MarR family transcriptional regulator [Spirochaetales bacterium]
MMDNDLIFKRTADFISDLHELESSLLSCGGKSILTPLQSNLLQILYFTPGKTLGALSTCMNMNMPNTSREVKKLTEQGLITKFNAPNDKRIIELSLSDEGRKLIETRLSQMKEAFFSQSGEWTEDRARRFLGSLDILEKELFGR